MAQLVTQWQVVGIRVQGQDAIHNLANAQFKLGLRQEAMQQWQEAVRIDGSILDAQRNLGIVMLEASDLEGAIEHLELALRLAPNDVGSLMNLGAAHALRGDSARAVQLTAKAANVARMTGQADVERECQRRLRALSGEQDAHVSPGWGLSR